MVTVVDVVVEVVEVAAAAAAAATAILIYGLCMYNGCTYTLELCQS